MADRTCSIEGCSKPHEARGWCNMHYERWRKHGDPLLGAKPIPDPICSIEGCGKPRLARGWCSFHYERWRKHGHPEASGPGRGRGGKRPKFTPPPCSVEGCEGAAVKRGWCEKHYQRWKFHRDVHHVRQVGGTYQAVHVAVRKRFGPARDRSCVRCGGQAAEWAYDHSDPDHLLGVGSHEGCPYSLDLDRYQPMCVPCHRRFDKEHAGG